MNIKNVIAFAKKLIRIQSTHVNPHEIGRAIDVVTEWFKKNDIEYKRYESNGFPSVVATSGNKKSKKFRVLMNGHLDVVAADEGDFSPYEKAGKLYGRGASDMKVMVSLCMHILKDAKKKNIHDLALLITTDEEIGGMNGTQFLLEKGYTSNWAFVPDSGDNWNSVLEEKGILHVKARVRGKSAHASRPWNGESANDKLISTLQLLRREFPIVTTEKYTETMNIGKIVSGDSVNQVADYAECYLDFRFTSKYTVKKLLQNIRKLVGKNFNIEILASGEVNSLRNYNRFVDDFRSFAAEKYSKSIVTRREPSGSDGRFFAAHNIPTLLIKPSCGNQHAKDEWINIKDFETYAYCMLDFIEHYTNEKHKRKAR